MTPTLKEVGDRDGKGFDLPWYTEGPDVQILWGCGYYDGVRTGICTLHGKEHWFELVNDEVVLARDEMGVPEEWGWVYAIVEISPEELKYERHRHQEFEKYVGTHCSYTYENGRRARSPYDQYHTAPKSFLETLAHMWYGHNAFYRQKMKDREYRKNHVVGLWATSSRTQEMLNWAPKFQCGHITDWDDRLLRCYNEAAFQCCDKKAPVCERHKCDCAKPLTPEQLQEAKAKYDQI